MDINCIEIYLFDLNDYKYDFENPNEKNKKYVFVFVIDKQKNYFLTE